MTTLRASTNVFGPLTCLSLVALLASLACKAEAPQPESAPEVAPEVAPALEPEVAPEPEVTPEPEPAPVPEGCKVVIDGGEDSEAAIKRALVNTKTGGLYDTTVGPDGREITFECPPIEERAGANIIAEKTNSELVHWAEVDLAPGDEGRALAAADARPDLPEGLDEETLERLRAKWPDLAKWDEEAEAAAPADRPAAPAKVPVSFSAHKLYWAELKLQHKKSGKSLRLVLDPKGQKPLAPGTYALSVKLEADGSWQDAGELVIEAGKSGYSVQMLDSPPRPSVSSR